MKSPDGPERELAICAVDAPDEFAPIIRLRKLKPELPIVMLTQSADPTFRRLGEQMGAGQVVTRAADLERTAELLLAAFQSRKQPVLPGDEGPNSPEGGPETLESGPATLELSSSSRDLVEKSLGVAAGIQPERFVTLMLEDDPADALLVERAMKKAGLPPMILNVPDVASAKEYLRGHGVFHDRAEYPFPSLIISDLHLGTETGLDFLRWVRTQPAFGHLGFILFTSSDAILDMTEAERLRANFYVLKSPTARSLVAIVRSVYEHAMRFKSGLWQ
jgi:CheY-like chemotaxis protein